MEGATRLSPFAGEPSRAMVIKLITPAVTVAGEAMPKGTALEVTAEAETVILTVPGCAMRELETDAAKSVLSPKLVGSEAPFHWITDAAVKPVPLTRSWKGPCPAIAYVPGSGLPAP